MSSENQSDNNAEIKRRYPSRRECRGGRSSTYASQGSSLDEVIKELPASTSESKLGRAQWVSPRVSPQDRLAEVAAEIKNQNPQLLQHHNQTPPVTEDRVKPEQQMPTDISTQKQQARQTTIASDPQVAKPAEFHSEAVAKHRMNTRVDSADVLVARQSGPITITDTQSALTATQIKAEIRRQKKKKRRRHRLIFGLILVLVLAIAGGGIGLGIKYNPEFASFFGYHPDYQGKGTGEVNVNIPKGSTGTKIGQILVNNDVVASVDAFVSAFNKNASAQGIQPGKYKLAKHMSAKDALAALLDPKNKVDLKLTIPEGLTKNQIADRISRLDLFSKEQVSKAMEKVAKSILPPEAKGNLEGWLGPDTYILDESMTADKLIKMMVEMQISRLKALGVKPADYEIVLTKASILEREAANLVDFGKVARVIDNRLKVDSPLHGFLQMDSTVDYGNGSSGPITTAESLKKDTPYNTYLHPGLPPTPIANPGKAAIKATLNPTPGNWLYFVTTNLDTGETRFASTLEEQNKNVSLLRQFCKKHPDKCQKK